MTAQPLADLYRETILDHGRNPRRMGPLEGATHEGRDANRLCGDAVTIRLIIANGHIADARFEGEGCAISQASASMLTDALPGLSPVAASALAEEVRDCLSGTPHPESDHGLASLLAGVRAFPERVTCAMLGANALARALASETGR